MSSRATINVIINGRRVRVTPGTSAAAAMWNHGQSAARASVSGEPRGALCGMGTCFECRATIDGVPHERSCMTTCVEGMRIETTERR
jgi:D-hydroxyproline dehydrogenase subunit gamma